MDPPCSAPASCFRWGAPDSSACLAQRNMLGSPRLIIQRAVTRLTRSGGSRPELRLLRCRSSSGNSLCGQNSAGFRESARPFKGIICDDISEFESYHPSQAVGLSSFGRRQVQTSSRSRWRCSPKIRFCPRWGGAQAPAACQPNHRCGMRVWSRYHLVVTRSQ